MTTTATMKKLKGFRTLVLLAIIRLNAEVDGFLRDKLQNFAIARSLPGKKQFFLGRANY